MASPTGDGNQNAFGVFYAVSKRIFFPGNAGQEMQETGVINLPFH